MYDSSSDDEEPKIQELRGEENFCIWEAYAIHVLRMQGLEGFIRGTEIPPAGDTPQDQRKLRDFKSRKYRAWRLLFRSVESALTNNEIFLPGYLHGLYAPSGPDSFDAKELWDALQRWYTDVGPDQKLDYLREFTNLDYRQFEDLNDFIARAYWLRNRLKRLDIPVSDEMMKTCLWGGLADYPSSILDSMKMMRYDKWTSEDMISDIRKFRGKIEEQARKHEQQQQELNRRRNANRQSSG